MKISLPLAGFSKPFPFIISHKRLTWSEDFSKTGTDAQTGYDEFAKAVEVTWDTKQVVH